MNKREARKLARKVAAETIKRAISHNDLIGMLQREGHDAAQMREALEDVIHMLLNPGVSVAVLEYHRQQESEEEPERWQDNKELDRKFWDTLNNICEEKGIDWRSGSCIVDRGFSWNYMEHEGTFEEAIEILRCTADEMIADKTIRMKVVSKPTSEILF